MYTKAIEIVSLSALGMTLATMKNGYCSTNQLVINFPVTALCVNPKS